MIDALLNASLRYRWLVLAGALAVSTLAIARLERMRVDVFPDLTAPRVTVVTEATGLATVEVEELITFPIESAVNGTEGVRRVRSASAPGISIVWVEFDWDTNSSTARQRVTERLQTVAGALPPVAGAPLLAPSSSVMGEIAFVAMTSESVDPLELRRVAEVEVRRQLIAVDGISQVVAIGGLERQYQVLADPLRLERFGLTITEIAEAIEGGNLSAPGGYIVDRGQEAVVRVRGRVQSVEDLERMVVRREGEVPIRLQDVADIEIGPALARGAGSYRGSPAIVFSIVKQPTADTLATTERMDETLDRLSASLAGRGIELHRDVFRQSDFIDRAIDNLSTVLRDGAIIVIVILGLFLFSLRPTVISALAIPLSLALTVIVLELLGYGIDTMTLGGLAIAIGELVDDAIVDVENVMRRLRERASLPADERKPVLATVLEASSEIRTSIVSATAVIMLVFLPILFLTGLEGRLLQPLAVAYLVAIGASLLVAVTVTPVLCYFLLPRVAESAPEEPPVMRWLHRLYEPVLRFSLRRPMPVIAMAVIVFALGVGGLFGLGRSFLPEFNEGSLTVSAVAPPGTSLEQSDSLGRLLEEILLQDPAVVSTARRTGRAERDEHVQGVEASELEVHLRADPRSKEELVEDLRERASAVPGLQLNFGQPISHRIDHMLSGQRAALSIKVVGDELALLKQTAEEIRDAIATVPGLADLGVEQIVELPQVAVRVDRENAGEYGLSMGAAADAVGTVLWGKEVGNVYEGGLSTPIVLRYGDDARADMDAVRAALIPTPTGASVPVSALASVDWDTAPNYVLREQLQRRLTVTANVTGRDLRSAYEEIRQRVEELELPAGVAVRFSGQFEREEETGRALLLLFALVFLGIIVVLGVTLRGARRTAVVLVNLPLALAGGVVGVYLGGGILSIAGTIGFITLFGIATRNGILLATRVRDLEEEGTPLAEAVERASLERLAPILMTAVTAALGLLPLALSLGEPGSEIQAPMALVILCGLTTSTALNAVVVPSLLARPGALRANA